MSNNTTNQSLETTIDGYNCNQDCAEYWARMKYNVQFKRVVRSHLTAIDLLIEHGELSIFQINRLTNGFYKARAIIRQLTKFGVVTPTGKTKLTLVANKGKVEALLYALTDKETAYQYAVFLMDLLEERGEDYATNERLL